MSRNNQYRDKDGFIILKKRENVPSGDSELSIGKPASNGKNDAPLGMNRLYYPKDRISPGDQDNRATTYQVYLSNYKNSSGKKKLITAFPKKAWQTKAWNLVGRTIDWNDKRSLFKNSTWSSKTRHIKRIGIMCRVRAEMDTGRSSVVLDHLNINRNDSSFPYLVIDTPSDLKTALETIQRMMYVNIEQYMEMCSNYEMELVTITLKAIIIYDDYTYDTVVGNPNRLFEFMQVKVDKKGKVTM